ncbi:MAG: hypothetical protein ACF8OB_11410 [Phycisphaeraceae bacterium JB051]
MQEYEPSPTLPTSLKVVAVLFIICGVLSILEMIGHLINGHININFGALGIFIGPGLFKLKRGWRTCGLVLIWLVMITALLVSIVGFFISAPATLNIFGQAIAQVPAWTLSILGMVFFAVALWMYRVLTNHQVRRLFGIGVNRL